MKANTVLLGLLLLLTLNITYAHDAFTAMDVTVPHKRMSAPDFSLPDLEGKMQSLSTFKGKTIFLTFWATWCAPCREEIPAMQALWEKYRQDNIVFIAINIETNNLKGIEKFIQNHNITFPILLDEQTLIRNNYEISGLPTTYIIGRDGKFSGKIAGNRDWGSSDADQLIQAFIP